MAHPNCVFGSERQAELQLEKPELGSGAGPAALGAPLRHLAQRCSVLYFRDGQRAQKVLVCIKLRNQLGRSATTAGHAGASP